MHTILASGRSRFSAYRFLFLVAATAALVLGVAGTAGAGSPVFDDPGTMASSPGNVSAVGPGGTATGSSVAYSTDAQPTYVSYTITYARNASDTSNLTHAVVSAPVDCNTAGNCTDTTFPTGAKIVSLTGNCPVGGLTYRGTNQGFSCSYGSLRQGATISLTMVVQTPPAPASPPDLSLTSRAALTVKEGANDSQPNAQFTDTFPTGIVTTPLTSNTTSGLNTFTNPSSDTVQTFFTNKNVGQGNPQSTQAVLKKGVAVAVGLAESDFTSCPGTSSGLTCFGQLSTITIDQSGATGPFACDATNLADTNCLQFTVVVAGSSLTFSVSTKKVVIYHGLLPVPLCSTGKTDTGTSAGDCIVSIVQDSKTKNITWVARGPSNGGWGGAG